MDFRAAQIVCVLVNSNLDPKKRSVPFEVKDFMTFRKESKSSNIPRGLTKPEQPADYQKQVVIMLNRLFGGKTMKKTACDYSPRLKPGASKAPRYLETVAPVSKYL